MRSDSNFALVDRALLMTVDANGTGAAIVDLARAEGKRAVTGARTGRRASSASTGDPRLEFCHLWLAACDVVVF
jgi:hypothetical protein